MVLKEFFKKYGFLFVIYLIYAFFCIQTWGHYGSIVSDSFREAVLPQALLEGKVFYKDFFILYPPLGYYLNALLFKIFGNGLATLYLAGMVSGALLLGIVYKIVEVISNKKLAFAATLSVMFINAFRIWEFNTASWFFPYSYSFLYAFVSVFAGILTYIIYLKTKNIKLLYSSVFFAGLSFAFKLDFILFVVPLIVSIIRQKSAKTFLRALLIFFIPTLFSLVVYFSTGGNFTGLKDWIAFLIDFSRAESVKAYNASFMPQKITSTVLSQIGTSFFYALKFLLIFFFVFFITELAVFKAKKKWPYILLFLLLFIFIGPIKLLAFECISYYTWLHFNFVFLPYLLFALALVFGVRALVQRQMSPEVKTFLILFMISFCISFRNYGATYLSNIGNFTVIGYLMTALYFAFKILPKTLNSKFQPLFKKALVFSFVFYSLNYAYIYLNVAANQKYKIQTQKGVFYLTENAIDTVNLGLEFAKNNIKGNKTLLSFDEGNWVTYLNDIQPNYKLHLLNRHTIEALGEENVLNEISKNPPDYIYYFILPVYQRTQGQLGVEHSFKLWEYIIKNYKIAEKSNRADEPENKTDDTQFYYRLIIYEKNN